MSIANPEKFPVGPHGVIWLEDVMGDDLAIVNAARQSFNDESRLHFPTCAAVESGEEDCDCIHPKHYKDNPPSMMTVRDIGILRFLMRQRHGTPFEQVEFKFRVRAPIFVIREWVRHRIAEINEESGRYSVLKEEFWFPEGDAVRTQVGKPGAYTYEALPPDMAEYVQHKLTKQNKAAFALYYHLLEDCKLAKEVARTCLPLSTYSSFTWKSNLRALFNFLSLRNASDAQREIREFAEIMEPLVTAYVPYAMEAFNDFGRRNP